MTSSVDLRRPRKHRAKLVDAVTEPNPGREEEPFDEPATPAPQSTVPVEEPMPVVRSDDAATCEPPDEVATPPSDLN